MAEETSPDRPVSPPSSGKRNKKNKNKNNNGNAGKSASPQTGTSQGGSSKEAATAAESQSTPGGSSKEAATAAAESQSTPNTGAVEDISLTPGETSREENNSQASRSPSPGIKSPGIKSPGGGKSPGSPKSGSPSPKTVEIPAEAQGDSPERPSLDVYDDAENAVSSLREIAERGSSDEPGPGPGPSAGSPEMRGKSPEVQAGELNEFINTAQDSTHDDARASPEDTQQEVGQPSGGGFFSTILGYTGLTGGNVEKIKSKAEKALERADEKSAQIASAIVRGGDELVRAGLRTADNMTIGNDGFPIAKEIGGSIHDAGSYPPGATGAFPDQFSPPSALLKHLRMQVQRARREAESTSQRYGQGGGSSSSGASPKRLTIDQREKILAQREKELLAREKLCETALRFVEERLDTDQERRENEEVGACLANGIHMVF